jgi:hypothetical protein
MCDNAGRQSKFLSMMREIQSMSLAEVLDISVI